MKYLLIVLCLIFIGCNTTLPPIKDDGPRGEYYEADLTPDSDGSELED